MPEHKANNFKTENSIWDKDSGSAATAANFALTETDYHATTHCLLSVLSTFKILLRFLQRIYFHHNRVLFRNAEFRLTQGCPNNEVFKSFLVITSNSVCFPKCGSREISYFACRR